MLYFCLVFICQIEFTLEQLSKSSKVFAKLDNVLHTHTHYADIYDMELD